MPNKKSSAIYERLTIGERYQIKKRMFSYSMWFLLKLAGAWGASWLMLYYWNRNAATAYATTNGFMKWIAILSLIFYAGRINTLMTTLNRKKVLVNGVITDKKIEGDYSGFQTHKIRVGNAGLFTVSAKQYHSSEIGHHVTLVLLVDEVASSHDRKEILSFELHDSSEMLD